ncbi:MAG: ABC transporter ATP-binding protein [Gammaproteobacteria bacterium]|nr:ABC transporter ATP-binding protein [Gammaproteobacteria bacterium]
MSAMLEVRNATVTFPRPAADGGRLTAVGGATFALQAGEILGLVGESGCGKSSLGRAILGLVPLAAGEIRWRGRRIDTVPREAFRPLRRELQLVFQDPAASFDPRMTIAESVAEPLRALVPQLSAPDRAARVEAILGEVGLAVELAARYPHQLSGGQLQRAGIARALIVDPAFLVCDEPVSALDVSVQGQIVNLLARIRRERGLACLFISHNLAVVAHLAERILVMHRGRIIEDGLRDEILQAPRHPYTRTLLDSVLAVEPVAARRLIAARPSSRDAVAAPELTP